MVHVSAHYVGDIIGKCAALGIARDPLLSCVPGGETALSDPIRRLPVHVLLDIYETAARMSGREHIGLVIGQQVNVATMYETGKLLPLCSTLREVISMVSRYHRLTQTFGKSR